MEIITWLTCLINCAWQLLPPTTLVDKNYVITPILDHFNVTLPVLVVFLFIPTIKLHLDSLEAELKNKTQEVANISMNFREEASRPINFLHTPGRPNCKLLSYPSDHLLPLSDGEELSAFTPALSSELDRFSTWTLQALCGWMRKEYSI